MTREDINDIINAICPNDEDYEKPCISPKYLRQELEQLALDQKQWNKEPATKNNLSSELEKNSKKLEKNFGELDCISRAKARSLICKIDRKYMFGMSGKAFQDLYKGIDELPSVTPQEPKTVHKVSSDLLSGHYCPKCMFYVKKYYKYCPNCGAKMESEEI